MWKDLLCILAAGLWTLLPAKIYEAKHRDLLTTLWVTANMTVIALLMIEFLGKTGGIS